MSVTPNIVLYISVQSSFDCSERSFAAVILVAGRKRFLLHFVRTDDAADPSLLVRPMPARQRLHEARGRMHSPCRKCPGIGKSEDILQDFFEEQTAHES